MKYLRYLKKSLLNFKPVMCIWKPFSCQDVNKSNIQNRTERRIFLDFSGNLFTLKTFQFRIQKSVSDNDFLFTFNVYHMDDKDESDLVHLFICWYLLVLSWIKCYIISKSVANHMQMWLGKKIVISHFGYWHFLSTANTENMLVKKNTNKEFSHFPQCNGILFYSQVVNQSLFMTAN